ncbi:MAG: Gfo/Idh/MocA family oxidoreductase [Anaerolineae bacterium]|jgi:predicted dehydrogenase|nr:Gfo/Idh/MocA family oxidoreductase [Anaerolineae bacterium]
MRTAIIGTGFVAELHAQVLQGLGHSIIAVVNPTLEKAEAFGNIWGAKHAFDDLNKALDIGLDTVHICTPPISHVEIVKACIAAETHLFCEKPLTVDAGDAAELFRITEEKHLIHALNFNNRFYAVCEQARQAIATEDFGSPYLIHGNYLQEFHALPDFYSWRYKPEVAGPMRAVTEIGSHWIDLARYWSGLEIEAVSAVFGCFQPDRKLVDGIMHPPADDANLHIASEDAAAVFLRFSNGAMGNMMLSEVSHGRGNQLKLEVSSGAKSIWWNSEYPYQLHHAKKFAGVTTQTFPFGHGFMGTFTDCMTAFYEDVEEGKVNPQPRYATFKDGAVNAAICDAIYLSATHASQWTPVEMK